MAALCDLAYHSYIATHKPERSTMGNSITISAEYSPGIGWQYVVHTDGKLVGRYGSFDTEGEAIRAGRRLLCA